MNVVFFGSDAFALPTIEALAASPKHLMVQMVSQPDRPAGRGRRLSPTPAAAWARRNGLPLICPANVNAPDVLAELGRFAGPGDRPARTGPVNRAALFGPGDRPARWDIGVVVAFGQKIGNELLGRFHHGCINLHGSLLPKYRGAAPVAWAIINGEARTGVSVFRLVEKMDAGPVACRRQTDIGLTETADELAGRLAALGAEAVLSTLDAIEAGQAQFAAQDESQATRAPKLHRADGRVEWNLPSEVIARRIRGLYPWPGVHARFVSRSGRIEQVVLARAVAVECSEPAQPGTVTGELTVAAGQGAVRILQIKPANHRLMDFADFVHGRHVAPGDRFEDVDARC